MGNALDVDEVEVLVGIKPSYISKIGDESRLGEKLKTNVWGYASQSESSDPLDLHLQNLLRVLEPKSDVIRELLTMPGVEGQLFVGLGSPDAIYLSNDLINRIANLGLSVDFDLF